MHSRRDALDIDSFSITVLEGHNLWGEANFAIGETHLIAVGQAETKNCTRVGDQKGRVLTTGNVDNFARFSSHFTQLNRSRL